MSSNYAPIILFCYNRPFQVAKTLHALSKNIFADESELFIFCDGPKSNVNDEDMSAILEVRKIASTQNWARKTQIIQRESNLGLANSIITGVTHVLSLFDNVIVLEDDIVPEEGFLKYMNEALVMYKNETKVGCIHAWNYNMKTFSQKQTTFFLKGADCWGWATWKRSWVLFNADGDQLYKEIFERDLSYEFNRNGTMDFTGILLDQINNKNDSWAIRWYASLFLRDVYCLHPVTAIVENIGFDGSGVHCGLENINQKRNSHINLSKQKIVESKQFYRHFKNKHNRCLNLLRRLKNYLLKKIAK